MAYVLDQPRAAGICLGICLLGAVFLLWPSGYLLDVPSDDALLMAGNREILNGRYSGLFAPQDVHVVPLFRLVRLYFELNFPWRFRWFELVSLSAHLAATVLVYALCRRFFRSAHAVVAATSLFGWPAIAAAAFIVKAHSAYILATPFLLGAVYCLWRFAETNSRKFAVIATLCLLAAVGFHSILAVAAIPGAWVSYYVLAGPPNEASRRIGATAPMGACAMPLVIGIGLWIQFCASATRLPQISEEPVGWLYDAFKGLVLHFGFLLARRSPTPAVLVIGTAALGALIFLARTKPAIRWLGVALALTVPPLLLALAGRGWQDYSVARYCYQTSLVAAVAAGTAVDLLMEHLGTRSARAALTFALVLFAAMYYSRQYVAVRETAQHLIHLQSKPLAFWLGWSRFFEHVAAEAIRSDTPFRLAAAEIAPNVWLGEVYSICYPKGRVGIVPLSHAHTTLADCARLQAALAKTVARPISFDRVSIDSLRCAPDR